ncbi:threonine aldolase family protein [Rhodovibrio salinarum]|uniref:L-threonine aldolase n=1 Tax=Rhodovibrio salinarum TaxID=1087 RepID=A0A934V0R0_9PROT|nr:low specificity L-threonine aldolase [Rhodovibrio salinarum]MBK1698562.1 low specificity L-threonine aldolase [Rhodovibrio salinarum]
MNFASDNTSGAHPKVLQALSQADAGSAMSYGHDPVTDRAQARLRAVFEHAHLLAYPVATGTATNALTLACLTPPWGAVYCHRESHINTDECGAPEMFADGAKLIPLAGEHGKLTPEAVEAALADYTPGFVHAVQPHVLALTQATEAGTVYTPDEVAALARVAHAHGLKVQMDGARFANALVTLGCTPAELTWKAGVDVLSFGATKNGALAAEAAVFFDPELARGFEYRRKRAGHLFSKMRYISAQLEAYLADDVWLLNAGHANDLARRLGDGLDALPGCALVHPVQANEVFCELPVSVADALSAEGFTFYYWGGGDSGSARVTARLVVSWNSEPGHVDALLNAAGRHAAQAA